MVRILGGRHILTREMVSCMAVEHLKPWLLKMEELRKRYEKKGSKMAEHCAEIMQFAQARLDPEEAVQAVVRAAPPKRSAPRIPQRMLAPRAETSLEKFGFGNLPGRAEALEQMEADFRREVIKMADDLAGKMEREVKTPKDLPFFHVQHFPDVNLDVLFYGTISGLQFAGRVLEVKCFPDGITKKTISDYKAAHYLGPKKDGVRSEIVKGRGEGDKDRYFVHAAKIEDGLLLECFISDNRKVVGELILEFISKNDGSWHAEAYHGSTLEKGRELLRKRTVK